MKPILLIAILAAIGLAACASDNSSDAGMQGASATLRDNGGRETASATFTQATDGVRVRLAAIAMVAGTYGVHIHAIGRCDPPDFASAGPHWNPASRQHGKDNPQGLHQGDLPNLIVGADGRGNVEYLVPGAMLKGGATPVLDTDGASIMIHASADDYRTDPSGNSGARISCGMLS